MISPVYKTRSTGSGNIMGKAGNKGNVIFQGMLPNILGNASKLSGECPQIFRAILPKHSG